MKHLGKYICLILGFQFVSVPVSAQSITSYALPDTLSSGDTFSYIITSNYQSSQFSAVYPNEQAFSDEFEFRGVQRFKGSGVQDSIVYRLQFFGVQDTVLGGNPVLFVQNGDTLALETTPVPIYFRSNLKSEEGELKPFKPIFEFARSWWLFILLGLLITILAFFAWRYRLRNMHRNPEPVVEDEEPVAPYVSPFYIFDSALRELKQIGNFTGEDGLMKWHVLLSDSIRTYLEKTHQIDALEMTTREINRAMMTDKIHPDVISLTFEILRQCDMVKFAKLSVDTHQTLILFGKAEKLRDLFRFMDDNRLNELKYQYEMRHGLRQEKSANRITQDQAKNLEVDHNKKEDS